MESAAMVIWCTEKLRSNFHAGLELAYSGVSPDNDSQVADGRDHKELDHYETMQLSPNADADTIQRVYRILAQRYHPDSAGTGVRKFSSTYVRHIASSVILNRAPTTMHAIAKPSSSIGKSSIGLRRPKDPRQNSASVEEF